LLVHNILEPVLGRHCSKITIDERFYSFTK
jgi:hypothetical protein